MKNFHRILCMLLACAALLGGLGAFSNASADSTGKLSVSVTQDYASAQEVLRLVNNERKKKGLKALKMDKTLTEASIQRAAEVYIYLPMESPHKRPNGKRTKTLDHRISYEDVSINSGYYSPESVVDGWMNSSVHKKGILLRSARSVGVAVCNGEVWVLNFSSSSVRKEEKSTSEKKFTFNVSALSKHLDKGRFSLELYDEFEPGDRETAIVLYRDNWPWNNYVPINPSSFSWSSSNTSVATVSSKGVIKALKPGKFTVTAKLKNGPNVVVKQQCKVYK